MHVRACPWMPLCFPGHAFGLALRFCDQFQPRPYEDLKFKCNEIDKQSIEWIREEEGIEVIESNTCLHVCELSQVHPLNIYSTWPVNM